MKKEDLKIGQRIWVRYGYSMEKAKVIGNGNGIVLFKLNWLRIIDNLADRDWCIRKSIFNPR